MSSSPRPSSRERLTSRFASCAWADASSEASGSSSTITDGSAASVRAIAIRCRCPPENSCGNRFAAVGREPDELAQLAHAGGPAGGGAEVERVERVGELRADLAARVERRVRVLEDELEARELARPAAAPERDDLAALEDDRARRRPDEPDRGPGERRLAAARLADEADDLPALDGDARAGDRADAAAAAAVVVDDDVLQLERAHPANGSTGQASARPFAATSAGTCTRQSSCAKAQRGLNAQPGGMLPGLGGEPGIATSGWSRRARGAAARRAAPACTDGAGGGARPRASPTRRPGPRRRSRRGRRSPTSRRGRA